MRYVTYCWIAVMITAGAAGGVSLAADPSPEAVRRELERQVRAMLEPALQENAGVGFRSFECRLPVPSDSGARLHCEGIDEDGDWLGYAIQVTEDGAATVALASERASGLDEQSRATLEAPCRRFLDQYQRRDWDALVTDLHPALRGQERFSSAPEDLRDMRELFGDVQSSELDIHAVRDSGRQELVYTLTCANGKATARFGVAPDDDGTWRVIAFLVTAPAGSPEQALLLDRVGRANLSQLTGRSVRRLDAPLAALVHPGDAVEGTIVLDDGRRLPIRVSQTGWKDDFDPVDYRFSILDVRWLVRRAVADRLPAPVSVECDAAVVPDGGETGCTAVGGDGSRLQLVVSRSGGDHRMRVRAPSGG